MTGNEFLWHYEERHQRQGQVVSGIVVSKMYYQQKVRAPIDFASLETARISVTFKSGLEGVST